MDAKAIGRRLRNLRGESTQQDVANAVGVSVSAVAMYENGERIPRDETKIKLSDYFGASLYDIFYALDVTIGD